MQSRFKISVISLAIFLTACGGGGGGSSSGDNGAATHDHSEVHEDDMVASISVVSNSAAPKVVNGNTLPVITSPYTVSLNENTTTVSTVVATDADAGDAVTYSIVNGSDSALFAIDPSSGALRFIAAPDFEAPTTQDHDNIYRLTVSVTDGKNAVTRAMQVAVKDVAETPTYAISRTEVFLPATMYTMLDAGDSEEYKIMAKQPVKAFSRAGKAIIYNLSPVEYVGASVVDSNLGQIASNLTLPAWTRTTIDNGSAGTVTVSIPSTNPVMAKFAQVSVNWGWRPSNFDPKDEKSNWMHEMSGANLRGFYTLNYKMAHFISTPVFEDVILSTPIINNSKVELTVAEKKTQIIDAMRNNGKVFNNWIVDGGPSGLGGGSTLGLGANQAIRHATGSEWTKGNIYTVAWFHEFAHCAGFEHSSNMTYGSGAYQTMPSVIQTRMLQEWQTKDSLIFPMAKSPLLP